MSDLHDDLAAAFKAAETSTPTDGSTPPSTPPAAPAATPPSDDFSEVPTPKYPNRGADGKFRAASPTAPAAPGAAPAATAATVPTPPPGGPPAPAGAAPAAPATPPAATPPGTLALDPSKPPSAWTPGMKAKWDSLPEDARVEITRREEASARGVAQLKQHYEPMEQLYKGVVHDNMQYFEHIQTEPLDYFQNLMNYEQQLTLGNPAQKMQTLLDLADMYQIPLRQVIDTAMNGQLNNVMAQAHQQHKTPPQIPLEIQRELAEARRFQADQASQAADAELQEFLADGQKPFFDEVKDKMADLIEKGVCEDFQSAYDMAVWQNPTLRARVIAQGNGQQQLSGIAARQAAAAAVSTPSAASVVAPVVANPNESTEDAVRRAWAAAATPGGV